MKSAEELLQQHGLRKTNNRLAILNFLREADIAISHGELSKRFGEELDRVTLYRTLQSFEQNGLIHKVPDDEVSVKYAFCGDSCSENHHHDNHVHFKCRRCHRTTCLHQVELPSLPVPHQFHPESTEVLITGLCNECAPA